MSDMRHPSKRETLIDVKAAKKVPLTRGNRSSETHGDNHSTTENPPERVQVEENADRHAMGSSNP